MGPYRLEYGGQFGSEAEASRRLLILGAGVILGILLILATAFHSTRDALIIMLNLPLALVGGVAGVYLAGGVLSVASIIGFIALFGSPRATASCWYRISAIFEIPRVLPIFVKR